MEYGIDTSKLSFSKDSKKDTNEALRAVQISKTIGSDADQDFKKDEDGVLKDSAGGFKERYK